jgi:hypothetical protein
MRPNAIVRFERLYLVSVGLVLAQQIVSFFFFRSIFNRFAAPDMSAEATGTIGFIMTFAALFGLIIALGIPLLFWWLAARKRQEFAKWVLLVISVLSVLNLLFSLTVWFVLPTELMNMPGLGDARTTQAIIVALDAAAEVTGVIAITYLFRREAVEWFRSRSPAVSADVFR